eukprot:gene20625-biopygen2588
MDAPFDGACRSSPLAQGLQGNCALNRSGEWRIHCGDGAIFWTVFALFAFLSRVGARDLGIPALAPRSGPPRANDMDGTRE